MKYGILVDCADFWPRTNCSGTNETRYINGTCYRQVTNSTTKLTHMLRVGLWDTEIAAKNDIEPALPSEEFFK